MLARAIRSSFTLRPFFVRSFFLYALSLSSLGLGLLGSCGPAQKEPAKAEAEDIPPRTRPQTYQDKDGVSEKGKQWGGWRYQGKREDCFFTVKRQCFVSKAEACKAAGCPGKSCDGDSSAPVKVSCKK